MLHQLIFAGNPPLIPSLEIPCFRASLGKEAGLRLGQVVMEELPNILATTQENPNHPDPTWLTSRFQYYNLFNYARDEIAELEARLRDQYIEYMSVTGQAITGACYIRGWANAFRFNERLVWHNHFEALSNIHGPVWNHVSGMVFAQTFGTKTRFLSPFLGGVGHDDFGDGYEYPSDVIGLPNVVGDCFFFPSWVVHRTDGNNHSKQPRITIAFDIITEDIYRAKTDSSLFKQLL